MQDHKDGRFRRPALPIAGARRRSGWSSYDGGAAMRRGKTLDCFRHFVLSFWRHLGDVFRVPGGLVSQSRSKPTWKNIRIYLDSYPDRIQVVTKISEHFHSCRTCFQKIKLQKEAVLPQGEEPDFSGPFTRMSCARSLRLRPSQARRASVYGLPFLSPHT